MKTVSTQQAQFLTCYQEFLTHCQHFQEIVKTIEQQQAPTYQLLLSLHIKAEQAYYSATNSYQKAIEADLEYREKKLVQHFYS